MADTIQVLSQTNPQAGALTNAYTVPGATSTVISTITVCNSGGSTATFNISIAVGGAADTIAQYIYYGVSIPAHNTFSATIGISLATTDIVRVYASTSMLSFNFFGVQVT